MSVYYTDDAITLHHGDALTVLREMPADRWGSYTITIPTYKRGSGLPEPIPLPADWRTTIDGLAADGMFMQEMLDAVDIAMARNPDDRFTYFVGIIRNRIRDRQQRARELLNEGTV